MEAWKSGEVEEACQEAPIWRALREVQTEIEVLYKNQSVLEERLIPILLPSREDVPRVRPSQPNQPEARVILVGKLEDLRDMVRVRREAVEALLSRLAI
ncbi:MAG: hypothetical protein V1755_13790 [Chloroflexota bacterium]